MQHTDLNHIRPYIRYVNNYKPDYSFTEQPRIIYDFELMYVVDGSVSIYYNGKLYQLKKNDIFYFRPNVENYMIVDAKAHFRTHCIHFDWIRPASADDFSAEEFYMHSSLSPNHNERIEELKVRTQYEPLDFCIPTHIQTSPQEDFFSLFSRCYYNFLNQTTASGLLLQASFYEIIALLAANHSLAAKAQIMHPQIIQAVDYLKSNYAKNITAPLLAEKYGLSPKYFGSLFKKTTGRSISEYILHLRIYAAKEMLLGSELTIEEIAAKTGFDNTFYFSNCFKRLEHIPPSKYRSLMRSLSD